MRNHTNDFESSFPTLADLLEWRANNHPDRLAYCYLPDGQTEGVQLTYGEFDRKARAIAALLQQQIQPGDRALLFYPPGQDFTTAFFGCLYAGVIAVPAFPPGTSKHDSRLHAIAVDAQGTVILTTASVLAGLDPLFVNAPGMEKMHWLATDQLTDDLANDYKRVTTNRDNIALLQYTSGSTSLPKGVIVSHGNLMYESSYLDAAYYENDSIEINWMPHYHDYGLIQGFILPIYKGIPCYFMPPVAFIQNPVRWLNAISRYRGTNSSGPNFAYELCIRRATPELCLGLDLSCWRMAGNGAEPVHQKTMAKFVEIFSRYGITWKAIYPAYGLAEATLVVATKARTNPIPVVLPIKASELEQQRATEAAPGDPDVRPTVSCGRPIGEAKVAIVNPETLERCTTEEVGEIWVSSPSVTQGYWKRPDDTKATFHAYIASTGEGPFLRTGDLGFIKDEEVFVTGRLKDLIIIDGLNHYPQDIEYTVEQSHSSLRPGGSAAFSINVNDEEKLVVMVSVTNEYQLARTQDRGKPDTSSINDPVIIKAIRRAIAEEHDLAVYDVVLLPPNVLKKTSSGKLQRRAYRSDYLSGTMDNISLRSCPKNLKNED